MSITRRDFLIGSTAVGAGASVCAPFFLPKYSFDRRQKRSRVAVLHAKQYSEQLDQILREGLQLFPLDVRDKTVVLKPNLVDYLPGDAINTHPMLVSRRSRGVPSLGGQSLSSSPRVPDINVTLSWCSLRVATRNHFETRKSDSSTSIATN